MIAGANSNTGLNGFLDHDPNSPDFSPIWRGSDQISALSRLSRQNFRHSGGILSRQDLTRN